MREEPCRGYVVMRRNNGVIKNDGHICLLLLSTARASPCGDTTAASLRVYSRKVRRYHSSAGTEKSIVNGSDGSAPLSRCFSTISCSA